MVVSSDNAGGGGENGRTTGPRPEEMPQLLQDPTTAYGRCDKCALVLSVH